MGIFGVLKHITVEPILFCYMMLIFLETNALSELILLKSCLQLHPSGNMSDCNQTDVRDYATYWSRNNLVTLFAFTFLSSFYVASWSDKFGQKLTIIIPTLGTVIAGSINCCLSIYMYSDIVYLLISSTISGLTFGSLGVISSSFRYISDRSDESSRTKRIVILEAMIFIGGTAGLNIAKDFLKYKHLDYYLNSFAQLFIFEITVSACITLYTIVRLSDSNLTYQLPLTFRNLFKLDHVVDSLKAVFRDREDDKRKSLLLLFLALFFIYIGFTVQITLAYYYVRNPNLKWDFSKYSDFNAIQLAVEGIALVIGLPLIFHFWQISDYLIAVLGVISRMVSYIVFGLSTTDGMVYLCAALYVFSEYPVPAIRSMLSKIVDADERGRIFMFSALLQNISYLIGAFSLMSIFHETQSFFPGLCFEVAAALQAIPLIIFGYLYFTRRRVIVTYEIMENDDGSLCEEQVVIGSGSIQ